MASKSKQFRVRVKGSQPIHEDGNTYEPARKTWDAQGNLKVIPAQEFVIDEERLAAVGPDVLEVVGEVPTEKAK